MSGLPFQKIQRKVLVRKSVDTSPKFGCAPEARTTAELLQYSVINIDKPRGPTSHQVSAYVQQILGIKKSGHSGTLDPKVTGVLPVAIGKATKVVQALLPAGKEYIALMHLHADLPEDKIRKVCEQYIGRIKQLPPLKSNVKREWRVRKIYYPDVLEIKGRDVLFRVGCQAGTYIRKLIHDLGTSMGAAAHMAELRRTRAGPFDESTLVTLQDLHDAYWYMQQGNDKLLRSLLQSPEAAVAHLPKVWVFDTSVNTLCHGADLKVPGISKVETDIQVDELVAIMTLKDELVAIGLPKMVSKEMTKAEKGLAVKLERVFMEPGIYPKITPAEQKPT